MMDAEICYITGDTLPCQKMARTTDNYKVSLDIYDKARLHFKKGLLSLPEVTTFVKLCMDFQAGLHRFLAMIRKRQVAGKGQSLAKLRAIFKEIEKDSKVDYLKYAQTLDVYEHMEIFNKYVDRLKKYKKFSLANISARVKDIVEDDYYRHFPNMKMYNIHFRRQE